MDRATSVINITKWIKLFTYISASILIISNNLNRLTFLIPLLLLIVLINYAREYIEALRKNKPQYILLSLVIEMLLIIAIGLIDKNDYNLLLFFVCVSSTIIVYHHGYAIFLVVSYFSSVLLINLIRNNFSDITKLMIQVFFNHGVAVVFVVGMSYLVKKQIREKEKLAYLNKELEQAYKKLIENSTVAQKLTAEQERTRMAREIHDTLAHTLTTLIVQLEACKKLASLDPTRLPIEIEKAQELSRSGFNDIKHSLRALRPQAMEDKTFLASIQYLINETIKNTNVCITLRNLLSEDMVVSSNIEVALFRIIQESITNSIRHGGASSILVTIENMNGMLQLYITDNGKGCSNIKKGYGILGIQERIEDLKGSVEFTSLQGEGFKTKVLIPCEVMQ